MASAICYVQGNMVRKS